MHPVFFTVDHRIGLHDHSPIEEKRVIKRGQPEALRLDLPPPGAPFVHYAPVRATAPVKEGPQRASWIARLFAGLRHAPAT